MVSRGVCKSGGVQLACCNLTVLESLSCCLQLAPLKNYQTELQVAPLFKEHIKKQKNCIEMEIGRREHKKGHMNHLSLGTHG